MTAFHNDDDLFGELRSLLHQPSWDREALVSLCEPMIHHEPDTYLHIWLPYIQKTCSPLEELDLVVTTQKRLAWHEFWLPFATVHFKPRHGNELFTAHHKLPWLELVRALTFKGDSKRLITMCREAGEDNHLTSLHRFDWKTTQASHAQWVELMGMPFAGHLRHLATGCVAEPTLIHMAREVRFHRLESLHLRCGHLRPEAFDALDGAKWLRGVKALTLESYRLSEASLERALNLEHATNLTRLCVRGCTLRTTHVETLLHTSYAPHLTHLDVSSCELEVNALRMLIESSLTCVFNAWD